MRFFFGSLALAIASFPPGLCALDTKPQLRLLPRSFETPQAQPPTCAYTALKLIQSFGSENRYTYLINLPGKWWGLACPDTKAMQPIMRAIKRQCLQRWSQKGLQRRVIGIETLLDDAQCRIRIKITAEPEDDQNFPEFTDQCILETKPEPCHVEGITARHFPWPSECLLSNVGLRLKISLLA